MKTVPSEFAFPFTIIEESHPSGAPKKSFVQTGMTIRDYIATEVSPTFLKWMLEVSSAGKITADEVGPKAAEASYGFADAMLRARGGDRD